MSTVNELAQRVKDGDVSAIERLWRQTEGLACWVMKRYTKTIAVEEGDLLQTAYFAMLEAAKAYDALKGSFTTLYVQRLRAAYRAALGLCKQHVDEIACLNMPIGEDEIQSMQDMIIDEDAIDPEEYAVMNGVREDVRKAVAKLPERWGTVIQALYFDGLTRRQIAERMKVSEARIGSIVNEALRRLRHDCVLQRAIWGMTEEEMYRLLNCQVNCNTTPKKTS